MGYILVVRENSEEEKIREFAKNLVEETNKKLTGPELCDMCLCIREPFAVNGKAYNNGFVGMHIKFPSKEPQSLSEKDREAWYSRMAEIAENNFGIDVTIARDLDWATIEFEEPTKEELYLLTPKKKSTITAGFDRIKSYAEWFSSAVKKYDTAHEEMLEHYLGNLEPSK